MAKKEFRRAVREGQAEKTRKTNTGPTIKGALLKGLLLSGIYLLLVRVLLGNQGRSLQVDLLWAAIFFVMYTGFVYLWDRWLWRRKQRKQQAAGK